VVCSSKKNSCCRIWNAETEEKIRIRSMSHWCAVAVFFFFSAKGKFHKTKLNIISTKEGNP
jgi:hypothetical protein